MKCYRINETKITAKKCPSGVNVGCHRRRKNIAFEGAGGERIYF
jgi:hypothetical protein